MPSASSNAIPGLGEKPKVQVDSDFAILIDADSGSVLFEKDARARTGPASTTKIMTGLLVCSLVDDLDETVEIGPEVYKFGTNNITVGLKEFEKVTVRDLIYAMLLPSANDAAAALAVHFGGGSDGDYSKFIVMMNDKVKELGLENTHFVNPHGLSDDEHYTTAYDLAMITREAMKNDLFAKVVATPEYTMHKTNKRSEEKPIITSNRFLSPRESLQDYHWSAVTGVKTGHTSAAQGCLVTSASKGGKNLIAVALHDTSKDSIARWDDCRKMLEYGFKEMDKLKLSDLSFDPISTTVAGASRKDSASGLLLMKLGIDNVSITGLRSDLDAIRKDASALTLVPLINQGKDLNAPVERGQIVGTCAIKNTRGEVLAVVDLVAERDVASAADDPSNPVASLVTSINESPKAMQTGTLLMIAFAAVAVLGVVAFLLIRRHTRRSLRFHSRRRRSGYYNYHR